MNSWYQATAHPHPDEPALAGDVRADVCVVGAGITGLSAALHLAEAGLKVVVLEAECVGYGASGRSGGQVLPGFNCSHAKLVALLGREDAIRLFRASVAAVELLKALIEKHEIDCSLTPGHAHVALKPRQVAELEQWHDELRTDGAYSATELWDRAQVQAEIASRRYIGALYDANACHLHPLNYTLGLARAARRLGVTIYERTRAVRVERGPALTISSERGRVHAPYVALAGNAYLNGVMPAVESRVMPVGTYIAATEPLGETRCRELIARNIAVADINFVLDYFRCSSDHRLLFGGRVSYSTFPPPRLASVMRARMLRVFPQLANARIDYVWGGLVAITINRAPHIGRLDGNVYFAQGYSGHGLAMAGFAGRIIADAIRRQAEAFDLFARIPHRPFPGGRALRMPILVLAMLWHRMRDWL